MWICQSAEKPEIQHPKMQSNEFALSIFPQMIRKFCFDFDKKNLKSNWNEYESSEVIKNKKIKFKTIK